MVDKILSEEFAKEVADYLEDVRSDFEDEDIDNALESLETATGKALSSFDLTIITRMIDDESLIERLNKYEVKDKRGNIFD